MMRVLFAIFMIVFIRKRSGDFLQVLSCKQKDRMYKIESTVKSLEDCIVYFCSSDRVAIAYSLYLGINCIRKVSSAIQMYRNFSETPTVNPSIQKFKDNLLRKNEIIELFNTGLATFAALETEFVSEMDKIAKADSVEKIKDCVKYAMFYYQMTDCYDISSSISYIRRFMDSTQNDNPTDSITYMDYIRMINQIVDHFTYANSLFDNRSFERKILDKLFPGFDPTTYYITKTKSSNAFHYGVIYGQSVLYMLYQSDNEKLMNFVRNCVDAIMNVVDDPNLHVAYSYFADRIDLLTNREEAVSGGGLIHYSKDALLKYCEYLDWANNDDIECHMIRILTPNILISIDACLVYSNAVEDIIDVFKVPFMPYLIKLLELIKHHPEEELTDRQERIVQFLKRAAMNYLYNTTRTRKTSKSSKSNKPRKITWIKAGGTRKRRIQLRTKQ